MQFSKFLAPLIVTLFFYIHSINANEIKILNFGITSVALKQDAKNIFDLTSYLSLKSGIEIRPKFAKNYDEIEQMLEKQDVDFAYVCGATYIEAKESANLEILVLPYFEGLPFYYSLIIARQTSNANSLIDFENRIFAFSDPKSNSGSLVPRYELKKINRDYREFFKEVIYTYDHSDSIEAVVDGYVDGASVDSLVYESYKLLKPEIIKKIKVVERFGPFQSTPMVIRKSIPKNIKKSLLEAFRSMIEHDDGIKILQSFGVCKFDSSPINDYSDVEEMIGDLQDKK